MYLYNDEIFKRKLPYLLGVLICESILFEMFCFMIYHVV